MCDRWEGRRELALPSEVGRKTNKREAKTKKHNRRMAETNVPMTSTARQHDFHTHTIPMVLLGSEPNETGRLDCCMGWTPRFALRSVEGMSFVSSISRRVIGKSPPTRFFSPSSPSFPCPLGGMAPWRPLPTRSFPPMMMSPREFMHITQVR